MFESDVDEIKLLRGVCFNGKRDNEDGVDSSGEKNPDGKIPAERNLAETHGINFQKHLGTKLIEIVKKNFVEGIKPY